MTLTTARLLESAVERANESRGAARVTETSTVVGTDVLMEPFDTFANWTTAGSPTPTIVAGRTGTAASIAFNSGGTCTYTIPAGNESDTVTIGFAFNPTAWGGGESHILELLSDTAATLHNYVAIRNDGSMTFGRGVSQLAGPTAAGTFTTGSYNYLEAQVKLHDTTGFYTVKINGTTIMSATNVDTKNAGTKTTFDSIRLLCGSPGTTTKFDDLYITMGAGAPFKGAITIP